MRRRRGLTAVEVLTVVVTVVVIAAVAIPFWRIHELRAQRSEAMKQLLDIQAAQDRHFGQHACYATPGELRVPSSSANYRYDIQLGADRLSYQATAHALAIPGREIDTRCTQMSIDQHGRRSASDQTGEDSTGDCWDRK